MIVQINFYSKKGKMAQISQEAKRTAKEFANEDQVTKIAKLETVGGSAARDYPELANFLKTELGEEHDEATHARKMYLEAIHEVQPKGYRAYQVKRNFTEQLLMSNQQGTQTSEKDKVRYEYIGAPTAGKLIKRLDTFRAMASSFTEFKKLNLSYYMELQNKVVAYIMDEMHHTEILEWEREADAKPRLEDIQAMPNKLETALEISNIMDHASKIMFLIAFLRKLKVKPEISSTTALKKRALP